jgi:hypothetical protein
MQFKPWCLVTRGCYSGSIHGEGGMHGIGVNTVSVISWVATMSGGHDELITCYY